jgi:hypothetical protein
VSWQIQQVLDVSGHRQKLDFSSLGSMTGMNLTGKGWYSAPANSSFPTLLAGMFIGQVGGINDRHVDY